MFPMKNTFIIFLAIFSIGLSSVASFENPLILSSSSYSHEVKITPPDPIILGKLVTAARILVTGSQTIPFPKSADALSYPNIDEDEDLTQQLILEIRAGLKYVLQTENNVTLCVHGTGSTAMEAVLDNLIEAGDRVLIPTYGIWAEVAAQAVTRLGGVNVVVKRKRGSSFEPKEVIIMIETYKPEVVVLLSGDSTGQRMEMEGIGDACKKVGCLVVADIVRVLGNQPFFMDKLGIDAIYAGVHKGLGATAGLGLVSFSDKAVKKALERDSTARNFLFDMRLWMRINYWKIVDEDLFADSIHSFSIPLMYSLREALNSIAAVGLRKKWEVTQKRHAELRRRLKEEIPSLRFYGDPNNWLDADMLFHPPKGRNNTEVKDFIREKHRIAISNLYEGMCRISMLGYAPELNLVEKITFAVKDAWNSLGVFSEEEYE